MQVNQITSALQRRKEKGLRLLDLTDTNPTENGFIFPRDILAAEIARYLKERRYRPDSHGNVQAREAISQYYSQRNPSLEIAPEHIFITASTSEAYSLIFSILCDPGDSVLAPQVCYPLFDLLAEHNRIRLSSYRLQEKDGWEADVESLEVERAKQVRACIIISPHNPTGKVQARRSSAVAGLDLPLICDEVFAAFTYREGGTPPLGAFYPDIPVFHLNGISKMFALPDLKLAWAALNKAAYERFGKRLEMLNDAFLSANALSQHLLPALFARGWPFVEDMKARVYDNISAALAALQGCPVVHASMPDGGFSLFPRLSGKVDEESLVLDLLDKGVLVHPGYFYGAQAPDESHLMISCLTEKAKLLEGLDIVCSHLTDL